MSYNKYYTRRTGTRYNKGQFVSAGVLAAAPTQQPPEYIQVPHQLPNSSNEFKVMPPPPPPEEIDHKPASVINDMDTAEEDKKQLADLASESTDPGDEGRPYWMKVKKISNKERRRRQNNHLRRLLTPKSAVMVLNEMLPKDQMTINTKVEFVHPSTFGKATTTLQQGCCVELTIDGNIYVGFGENKVIARNCAAEQALRDIMVKKMIKISQDGDSEASASEEDTIPMIQLASYALHKLFAEWEAHGHKVPVLRPCADAEGAGAGAGAEAGAGGAGDGGGPKPKKAKVLPGNARRMHPCMLMTYMRPALEYRDVAAEGDRPQNMLFTVSLDVDGEIFLGKAANKREARKAAARAAALQLFGVRSDPDAADTAPEC